MEIKNFTKLNYRVKPFSEPLHRSASRVDVLLERFESDVAQARRHLGGPSQISPIVVEDPTVSTPIAQAPMSDVSAETVLTESIPNQPETPVLNQPTIQSPVKGQNLFLKFQIRISDTMGKAGKILELKILSQNFN